MERNGSMDDDGSVTIDRFRRSGGDEYKVGDEIIVSTADTIIKQDLFQIEIASRADTLMREKKRLAYRRILRAILCLWR